jgi:hypothetical protein
MCFQIKGRKGKHVRKELESCVTTDSALAYILRAIGRHTPSGSVVDITVGRFFSPPGHWFGDAGQTCAYGLRPHIVAGEEAIYVVPRQWIDAIKALLRGVTPGGAHRIRWHHHLLGIGYRLL